MMPRTIKLSTEKMVRDRRRATRKHCLSKQKSCIVLGGLRGEDSIAALCRRQGIEANESYRCSKEFLKVGKKRFAGDTVREATIDEVTNLSAQASK